MDIQQLLKDDISRAISAQFGVTTEEIILQPTRKDFEGLYTFVTFSLTKALRQAPAAIGEAIGKYLLDNSAIVSRYNVVQGFLNLSLSDSLWVDALNDLLSNPSFGQLLSKGQSVMVEFSSPNTNKPLHLGHLRNNFLGASVAEILKASGYDVVKACLVNDRGIHICKSMLAYQKFGTDSSGRAETPESSGMKGDHLIGKYYVLFDKEYKQQIGELVAGGMAKEEAEKKAPFMLEAQEMLRKWEQGDPETIALWKQMNEWVYAGFNETYRKIGVSFDKTYYESQTYVLGKDVIEEGLEKGVFYRKEDGSVWIDLTEEGLDHKLVLRSDGTSVYITQDLGTTDLKFQDYHNDKAIWVVGNEQDYHFDVLFAILKRLGRPYANGCYHLSYGMVDLPSGKMKSREGTVVDGDELVQSMYETAEGRTRDLGKIEDFDSDEAKALYHMLALGALKYYLLKVEPKKRMLFNPQESIDFQGHTGPFIQYTHARIRSVLRKAEQMGHSRTQAIEQVELSVIEQQIIFLLNEYPQRIAEAGADYAPSYLAQYAYDLAKTYNQFYAELSILSETDLTKQKVRVAISYAVAETIQKAMQLLGIEVPIKM
ncbi:arginine--tRNA ligase [Tellurirhabdus bombi]|uniref:arginine--tRNA ligase n=1 Tax=Tellurirhabdus bombi TaxID=2907205 RepID=UPI001F00123B|nr:arginine--tRNA ligase [Tellurirhabdus bombi]